MALKYNNNDVSKVTYNGNEIQKVTYNGSVVWENYQYTQEGSVVTLIYAPYVQEGSEVTIQ